MTYTVDVKAFFSVEVEAPTPEAARKEADEFITRMMVAGEDAIAGYLAGQEPREGDDKLCIAPGQNVEASIDGESEVSDGAE